MQVLRNSTVQADACEQSKRACAPHPQAACIRDETAPQPTGCNRSWLLREHPPTRPGGASSRVTPQARRAQHCRWSVAPPWPPGRHPRTPAPCSPARPARTRAKRIAAGVPNPTMGSVIMQHDGCCTEGPRAAKPAPLLLIASRRDRMPRSRACSAPAR